MGVGVGVGGGGVGGGGGGLSLGCQLITACHFITSMDYHGREFAT